MDRTEILVVLGGLALIALTLWFFFGTARRKSPAAGGAYACPMHPWIVSDDPTATCSLCKMQLVKRES